MWGGDPQIIQVFTHAAYQIDSSCGFKHIVQLEKSNTEPSVAIVEPQCSSVAVRGYILGLRNEWFRSELVREIEFGVTTRSRQTLRGWEVEISTGTRLNLTKEHVGAILVPKEPMRVWPELQLYWKTLGFIQAHRSD